MNLSIFTVFLKNRNFSSKIKRSKVTDYAALKMTLEMCVTNITHSYINISFRPSLEVRKLDYIWINSYCDDIIPLLILTCEEVLEF